MTGKDQRHIKRTANFLICSIYKNDYDGKKYLGFILNFIEIGGNKTTKQPEATDSTLTVTDTSQYQKTIPSFYQVMSENEIYITKHNDTVTKQLLLKLGYSREKIREAIYSGGIVPIDTAELQRNANLRLWAVMIIDGLFDDTYQKFRLKYNNNKAIDYLYNGLTYDQHYTKSKDSFYKKYFPSFLRH